MISCSQWGMFESAGAYEPLFASIGNDFGREMAAAFYPGGITWIDHQFNSSANYMIRASELLSH